MSRHGWPHCVPALAALALLASCGGGVASMPRSDIEPEGYEVVPNPPPAALAEELPDRPSASAVWLDGHWSWRGRFWVWVRGGWVEPDADVRLVPADVRISDDGDVLHAEPRFVDASGRAVKRPKIVAPATEPYGDLTAAPAAGIP